MGEDKNEQLHELLVETAQAIHDRLQQLKPTNNNEKMFRATFPMHVDAILRSIDKETSLSSPAFASRDTLAACVFQLTLLCLLLGETNQGQKDRFQKLLASHAAKKKRQEKHASQRKAVQQLAREIKTRHPTYSAYRIANLDEIRVVAAGVVQGEAIYKWVKQAVNIAVDPV